MFLGLHTGYVSEFIRVHPPLDPNSVFQPRLNRSRGWRFRTGKFPPHLLKPSRTWLPGGGGGCRRPSFRFTGRFLPIHRDDPFQSIGKRSSNPKGNRPEWPSQAIHSTNGLMRDGAFARMLGDRATNGTHFQAWWTLHEQRDLRRDPSGKRGRARERHPAHDRIHRRR
eukprot:scaffold2858_cov659-Pavlova_lutheri.AAC.122